MGKRVGGCGVLFGTGSTLAITASNGSGGEAVADVAEKKVRGATPFLPHRFTLPVMREAVQECRGCDLYQHATQAVLGEIEGPAKGLPVGLMMIGEQPGDREDVQGHPFVGPAGKLLDRCLDEAGIERSSVYVTNVVKHFKWEPRGKRRLHKKPSQREIEACRPWLDAELEMVHPKLLVCLGATAAQAILGSTFRVTKQRGIVLHAGGLPPIMATVHPSSILRARTDDDRHREMKEFIADLEAAKTALSEIRRKA